MGNPNSNQMRAFADVVSIEAWHEEFGKGCTRADLHADVVFSTARMGGEDDSKVRFRLSVKRAELVVIIPETEPVTVDPKSVSRDTVNPSIQRKIKTNFEQNASVSGELKASASPQAIAAGASVSTKGEATASKKEETNLTIDFNGFNVQHRKDADGNHTWAIEGEGGSKLQGKPWMGEDKPRLTLVDKRSNPETSLPPAVRVEIRCLREDLDISDIELKENESWARNLTEGQRAKKLKAAEAYIRTKLEEEGLSSVKMDESFAQIIMAHITADSI